MPDDPHSHDHGSELSEMQLRVRALETILTEKGYVDPAALDQIVETAETRIGPHIGARIVARAWTDPGFKKRLLDDATAAANTLGDGDTQASAHLIAVENTDKVFHLLLPAPESDVQGQGILSDADKMSNPIIGVGNL